MAKELNMHFSGRIGPLVGCFRDGKYYYRSKPARMRQSKGTKRMATLFGLAAGMGKQIRLQLAPSIPNPRDKAMRLRLEGRIRQWLAINNGLPAQATDDIPFINQFNFHATDSLEEKLPFKPLIQIGSGGEVLLHLPAFIPNRQVKAPAGTAQLQLCLSAVTLRPGSDNAAGNSSILHIPYNGILQPAQLVQLQLPPGSGQLLLAALQLKFGIQQSGGIDYDKLAGRSVAAISAARYL